MSTERYKKALEKIKVEAKETLDLLRKAEERIAALEKAQADYEHEKEMQHFFEATK